MAINTLSGIERQLVLEYLVDGNVPVTVTPLDKIIDSKNPDEVPGVSSGIFPVAIRSEQVDVIKQGIILLKNPSESVNSFAGKDVKVQFYFNKLGLYFISQMKQVSAGLALVIPDEICKVEEISAPKENKYSAVLYFEAGEKKQQVNILCDFDKNYPLFVTPKWSDVKEDDQVKVKEYLENAVMTSKSSGKSVGNGLLLIPVCNFLATNKKESSSVEGRAGRTKIIYIDHERIVFAANKDDMLVGLDTEYAMKISFPLDRAGPIKERSVYVLFTADQVFESEDKSNICAVCHYTSIKEEDIRFLYELSDKKNILS